MKVTIKIDAPADRPSALTSSQIERAIYAALSGEIVHIESITVTINPD